MAHSITHLEKLLTEMVAPELRKNVSIIPDHVTMLHGTKSKKQLSRKRKLTKTHTLTRTECAKLGLFNIPRRSMKYTEALPLYHLWKGYMREHLELESDEMMPTVGTQQYDQFCKIATKIEFCGCQLRVIESKCATHLGIEGIVVLETKNVFKLVGKDDRIRTVPKSQCVFSIKFDNLEFAVYGSNLCIRPVERSTKKIRNSIEPLLDSFYEK